MLDNYGDYILRPIDVTEGVKQEIIVYRSVLWYV